MQSGVSLPGSAHTGPRVRAASAGATGSVTAIRLVGEAGPAVTSTGSSTASSPVPCSSHSVTAPARASPANCSVAVAATCSGVAAADSAAVARCSTSSRARLACSRSSSVALSSAVATRSARSVSSARSPSSNGAQPRVRATASRPEV